MKFFTGRAQPDLALLANRAVGLRKSSELAPQSDKPVAPPLNQNVLIIQLRGSDEKERDADQKALWELLQKKHQIGVNRQPIVHTNTTYRPRIVQDGDLYYLAIDQRALTMQVPNAISAIEALQQQAAERTSGHAPVSGRVGGMRDEEPRGPAR